MLTIIIVLLVFSVLILIHEAGHFFAAKKAGITVEAFSLGLGKRIWGRKIGETDYRICIFPFGGYVKMAGEDPDEAKGAEGEFGTKPVGHRFWVIAAGAITNYIFAFILFSVIFMMGIPTLSNEVGQILKGYPAEKAGMREGDEIISINDIKTEYWEDILIAIKKGTAESDTLSLALRRDGKKVTVKIKPEIHETKNIFGQKITRHMIGIGPANKVLDVSYSPGKAIYYGGRKLLELTAMTYKGIWLLLTGGMPVKTSVSGPIGIAYFIGKAASLGIVPLLVITAHISMALAIFNLLPFPVLDGGHLIFLGFEKLRGRPVSPKVQEVIAQIAIILLIAFALFVSWQDVLKFTPLGGK